MCVASILQYISTKHIENLWSVECGPAGHWQSGSHSGRLPDELLVSTVWTSTLQKRDCISSWVGAGGYCGTVSVHFGTLCTAPLLQLSAFCTFHFALITSTNLWVAGDRTIWTIWTTSKWFLGQWGGRLSTICWDRKWYKRLHKQTTTSYYMQSNKGVKEEPKQSLVYQSNMQYVHWWHVMKWWNVAHQIEVILICYDMTRAAIESVIKMLALGWSYHWIHNAAWPTIILSTTMHCRTVTTFDCTAIYALHYISRRHIHCNNVCSVHYISYALHFMALHNMGYISLQYPLWPARMHTDGITE